MFRGSTKPDGEQPADPGDEADDADRRNAEQTGRAVDQLLQTRWAALQRAEARLAAGSYGRSVRSGQPIPDQRLEADPLAELTVEEAQASEEDDDEPRQSRAWASISSVTTGPGSRIHSVAQGGHHPHTAAPECALVDDSQHRVSGRYRAVHRCSKWKPAPCTEVIAGTEPHDWPLEQSADGTLRPWYLTATGYLMVLFSHPEEPSGLAAVSWSAGHPRRTFDWMSPRG